MMLDGNRNTKEHFRDSAKVWGDISSVKGVFRVRFSAE